MIVSLIIVAAVGTSSTATVAPPWTDPPGERCDGAIVLILSGARYDDWPAWCQAIEQYLDLSPPFTINTATRAEALLAATTYFRSVRCRGEGEHLRCALEPQAIVADSELHASLPFALLEEDIDRRVFLRPGTLLDDPDRQLGQQTARISSFFEREGYFRPSVEVRAEAREGAEPNLGRAIEIDVDSGAATTLGAIELSGDPVLEAEEVESRLRHSWILGFFPMRFRPSLLEDDVDQLTAEIRTRGYPEASVEPKVKGDPKSGEVGLEVAVHAGPKLELRFVGATEFDQEELEKLATFSEAGTIDALEVEHTAAAIKNAYQRQGFWSAKAEASTEPTEGDRVRIEFRIREGPRAFIDRVHFEGGSLPEVSLPRLRTRAGGWFTSGAWVDEWVAVDIRTLEEVYQRAGFGAPKVEAAARALGDSLLEAVFTIAPGPKRTIGHLEIEGLPPEIDRARVLGRLHLIEGAPYVEVDLGQDRRTLLAELSKSGYPRAEIGRKLKQPYKDQGGEVTIHYAVDPGPRAVFGGLWLRGNFRTKRSVIEEQLELGPGDPLDLEALAAAKQRLRRLGIFASLDVTPLGLSHDRPETWLLVTVEERDQRTIDGVVSFSTSDLFSIGVDYRDRNLFGRALGLDLLLRFANASQLGTKLRIGNRDTADLTLRVPRPYGLPFDVESRAFYQRDLRTTFNELRVGGSFTLLRSILDRSACRYCPTVIASLGYQLSASQLEILAEGPVIPDPPATIGRIIPRLTADRRDSFVDPKNGWLADTSVELAVKPLAGPFAGSARSFWRFLINTQLYLDLGAPAAVPLENEAGTLFGSFVVALAARYALAHPLGTLGDHEAVPPAETFAYGGDLSVRGLSEGASRAGFPGANYLFVANLELRFYLLEGFSFGGIQLAAFADLGTVGFHLSELFDAPTLSIGPALRWVTPIGPLTVAYGWPVVRAAPIEQGDPNLIPATGRIHLSFGATF